MLNLALWLSVGACPSTVPSRYMSKRDSDSAGTGTERGGFLSRVMSTRKLGRKDSPQQERQGLSGRAQSEGRMQATHADSPSSPRRETAQGLLTNSARRETHSQYRTRQRDSSSSSARPREDSIEEEGRKHLVSSTSGRKVRVMWLKLAICCKFIEYIVCLQSDSGDGSF